MKKLFKTASPFFFVVAIALFTLQCKKESSSEEETTTTTQSTGTTSTTSGNPVGLEVPEVQNSLLVDASATWCCPCGQSGPMVNSLSKDKLVILNMQVGTSDLSPYYKKATGGYASSTLYNQLFPRMGIQTDANGNYGIPAFSLNGQEVANSKETIEGNAAGFSTIKPMVNTACRVAAGAATGELTIETKTKFFQQDDASEYEYFLALFIIEDDIDQEQNCAEEGYKHNHVVRAVVGGTLQSPVLLSSIAKGDDIKLGNEITKEFTFKYEDLGNPGARNYWKWNAAKTHIAAVVWKRDKMQRYSYMNASVAPVTP